MKPHGHKLGEVEKRDGSIYLILLAEFGGKGDRSLTTANSRE
jgi:hypothetical protein